MNFDKQMAALKLKVEQQKDTPPVNVICNKKRPPRCRKNYRRYENTLNEFMDKLEAEYSIAISLI